MDPESQEPSYLRIPLLYPPSQWIQPLQLQLTKMQEQHHVFAVHNPLVQTASGESVSSQTNHLHARNVDKSDLTPLPHAQEMKLHH